MVVQLPTVSALVTFVWVLLLAVPGHVTDLITVVALRIRFLSVNWPLLLFANILLVWKCILFQCPHRRWSVDSLFGLYN